MSVSGPLSRRDAFDAVLALGTAALVLADALLAPVGAGAVGYLLLLGGSLSLALRRRAPRAVLLFVTACTIAYLLRTQPNVIPVAPVLVAKYTAVSMGHRLWTVAVVSPLVGGALLANLTGGDGEITREVLAAAILPLGWFTAAFVLGESTRHRQAYLHEVEGRAAEAERTRDETALRRATEERLRIARELHDSLTHSISVIKVQAGVAAHLARKRGEEVPDALVAIQDASRDATRELRATLEVLRQPTPAEPAASGVQHLRNLVDRSRAAGVPAEVAVSGRVRDLPPDVDRAIYRIVQEALTNVARHAGPTTARVNLDYGDGEVAVRVDDDGRGSGGGSPSSGVGLLGMQERVAALGGDIEAGPRPGGGFTVHARIPLREGAPT